MNLSKLFRGFLENILEYTLTNTLINTLIHNLKLDLWIHVDILSQTHKKVYKCYEISVIEKLTKSKLNLFKKLTKNLQTFFLRY